MSVLLLSILFNLFNLDNKKIYLMSYKQITELPVLSRKEHNNGLIIVKYPLSYIYKNVYDTHTDLIISNGNKVNIKSIPNNEFDKVQNIVKDQKELFNIEDLSKNFDTASSFVLIKKNLKYFNLVSIKANFEDDTYFKSIDIEYYEPSFKFKHIKYLTKSNVKISIYPIFQARVNFKDNIFTF